jgi:hypothetical protein
MRTRREVSADELQRIDESARAREREGFANDRSIRIPFSGYAQDAHVNWNDGR